MGEVAKDGTSKAPGSWWSSLDRWIDPVDIGAAITFPIIKTFEGKDASGFRGPIEGFLGSVAGRVALDMMYPSDDSKKRMYEAHYHPVMVGVAVGGARAVMHGGKSFGHGFVEGLTAAAVSGAVIRPAMGKTFLGFSDTY